MTAVKEDQEEHRDRNENRGAPKGERRNVIVIGGFGGDEIDEFVENHRAADAQSCRREEGEQTIACAKSKDECGWDQDECAGEEMVEQIAGGMNVLNAD